MQHADVSEANCHHIILANNRISTNLDQNMMSNKENVKF